MIYYRDIFRNTKTELYWHCNSSKQLYKRIIMEKENKFIKSISIRADESMIRMIAELKRALPLNTSSIIRLALIQFYRNQKKNGDLNDR